MRPAICYPRCVRAPYHLQAGYSAATTAIQIAFSGQPSAKRVVWAKAY